MVYKRRMGWRWDFKGARRERGTRDFVEWSARFFGVLYIAIYSWMFPRGIYSRYLKVSSLSFPLCLWFTAMLSHSMPSTHNKSKLHRTGKTKRSGTILFGSSICLRQYIYNTAHWHLLSKAPHHIHYRHLSRRLISESTSAPSSISSSSSPNLSIKELSGIRIGLLIRVRSPSSRLRDGQQRFARLRLRFLILCHRVLKGSGRASGPLVTEAVDGGVDSAGDVVALAVCVVEYLAGGLDRGQVHADGVAGGVGGGGGRGGGSHGEEGEGKDEEGLGELHCGGCWEVCG